MRRLVFFFIVILFFSCKEKSYRYEYYENGSLKLKIPLNENKRGEGIIRGYFESGELLCEIENVDGVQQGVTKLYYSNGELEAIYEYKFDKKDGSFRTYYNNGFIESEGFYTKGLIVGDYSLYYEDGTLSSTYTRNKNSKPIGVMKNFHTNGKLEKYWIYNVDGEAIFGSEFNDLGVLEESWGTGLMLTLRTDEVKIGEEMYFDLTLPNLPGYDSEVQFFFFKKGLLISQEKIDIEEDTLQYIKIFDEPGEYTFKVLVVSNPHSNQIIGIDTISRETKINVLPSNNI